MAEAAPEEWDAALQEARKITEAERQRVLTLGGLHIIGTERHEARRIDNQLRGRAGRQGDPGSSQFYLSLEDELMRRFGRMETVRKMMDRLGGEDLDLPIQHGMLDKAIESAQSRVEGFNFDIRKHTVEFDDVMNTQRQIIYADRHAILEGQSMRERVLELIGEEVAALVDTHLPPDDSEMWDVQTLLRINSNINPLLFPRLTIDLLREQSQQAIGEQLQTMLDDEDMPERLGEMRGKEIEGLVERYLSDPDSATWDLDLFLRDLHEINSLLILKLAAMNLEGKSRDDIENMLLDRVEAAYQEREQAIGEEQMRYVERRMMLYAIDRQWIDYLTAMDELRQTINLQAYAQRNPLVEFKRHSFDMFDQLKSHIMHDIVYQILLTSFKHEENLRQQQREAEERLAAAQRAGAAAEQSKASRTVRKVVKEPGRNDPCPCGSGKKYKHCHLGSFDEIEHLLLQQDGAPDGQQAITPARPPREPQPQPAAVAVDNGAAEASTGGQKGRAVPRGRAAPPAAAPSTAASGGGKQQSTKKGKRKQKR
jgi:preprotein translocase subunit SecA